MTEKDKKRKYLLFKKDDGRPDHLKPCAFFASPEGCRNGSNCKFLHGAAPTQKADVDVSDVASVASSVPELAAPTTNNVKLENHKKRRTNDPGDEAPYPSFRVASAEDEIQRLKDQMNQQQKLFEEQFKLLTSKMQQPQQIPQHLPIKNMESRSMDPIIYSKLNSIQLIPTAQESSAKDKGPLSDTESDDEKFLFSTVNQILETGRDQPSNQHSASKAHKSHKHESKANKASLQSETKQVAPQTQQAPFQRATGSPFMFSMGSNTVSNHAFMQQPNTITPSGLHTIPTTIGQKHGRGSPAPNGNMPQAIGMSGINFAEPPRGKGPPGLVLETHSTQILQPPPVIKSPEAAKAQKKNVFAKPKLPQTPSSYNGLPKLDFKTLNYKHLNWDELVVKTQSHPRYKSDYSLNMDHTWISARSSLKSEYPVIALDCEMCETEDPVTQQRESTMIRLSVVNGFNPEEVLIDTLVSPQLPITDFRTRIHGIKEEQLVNVKYTLRHVQAALLNIITEQTIIIGHSVYNDLRVLRLNHSKCVDTAYLFPVENESEHSRPGLKLVAEQLLGLNVPEPHDSIMDSRIALYAAAFALERGCLPIKRSLANVEQPSLLVHRIPEYVTEEHIKAMLMNHSYIVPSNLSTMIRGDSNSASDPVGKVTVYFLTQQHADLAFETIQGPVKPDKKNRPQKKIYLQGGGHVYVRK